ncbi:hypothetical protein F383_07058 [Gossypium arboreum]|uniref:Uncharacterized protein n=1 Tax=Gossypium arboreum TaxID=29729 RepID=A0A0B0PH36_GOSAR|nr:hypothetical protein F383_07058 [Gossypium arboreum]
MPLSQTGSYMKQICRNHIYRC